MRLRDRAMCPVSSCLYRCTGKAWGLSRCNSLALRTQLGFMHSGVTCCMQVVARCAISTTMGGCFGGTVGIIVQLIYTKITTGQAVW